MDEMSNWKIVPELYVNDIEKSLAFYCGTCGFDLWYQRKEEGFSKVECESLELILDPLATNSWLTRTLEKPYGRGINFEFYVEGMSSVYDKMKHTHYLFLKR